MGGMDTLPRPLLPAPRPPCCSPLFLRHPKQAPSSCIWWKAGGRKVAEEGVFVHACIRLMCSPGSQLLVPGVLGGSRPQWSSWQVTKTCVRLVRQEKLGRPGWVMYLGSDASRVVWAIFLLGRQLSEA